MLESSTRVVLAAVVAALTIVVPSGQALASERTDRSFEVVNDSDGGTYELFGFERTPSGCAPETVILFQHGLSYTGESWDVPGYSYTDLLADRGYATVGLDRLGYGRSVLDDGYDVSTLAYASMAEQVATQLTEEFAHVVLAGHSAGGETVTTAAGVYGAPVDALVVMGYHTYPDPDFLVNDWVTGDQVRALQDDYEYFMGTPERRAEMFYTEHADPAVIAADTAAAVLTPSGEIQSISFQPSRIGAAGVTVPTLLQLAEQDALFPSAYAAQWAAHFVSAPSVVTDVVPGTGHTYMLHHEGPAAALRIADWLADTAGLPGCEADAAGGPVQPGPGTDPVAPDADPLPATGGGAAALGGVLLATALGRWRRPGQTRTR